MNMCVRTRGWALIKQTRISLSDYPNVRVLNTSDIISSTSIYDTVRGEYVTIQHCDGRITAVAMGESSTNDCPSTYRPMGEKTWSRAREMFAHCCECDVWDGIIAMSTGSSVCVHDRSGYMASPYAVDYPIDSVMFVAENIVFVASYVYNRATIINVTDGSLYVIA